MADAEMLEPLGATGAAPCIILVEPQLGENIGAAARAMANFGLSDLRLVRPRDGWPSERARANAAGADHVIDAVQLFDTVGDAISDLNFVCAASARARGMNKPVATPEEASREMHVRTAGAERCGVMFGPERSGLENDDIAIADWIVRAPVAPSFVSLNLAQAVLLVGYEWLKGASGETGSDPARGGGRRAERRSTAASRGDLLALFEHLETELDHAGFLKPPEKRPAMQRNLRNMILRMNPTDQDVRTWRGIVTALTQHARRSG